MAVSRRADYGFVVINLIILFVKCGANDILGCGGFVKSHTSLDYSKIEIGLYTKSGILKEKTECAPTNGYYFLPLYEKGDYILQVHPPPGWSFEPSKVKLGVDGVTDPCSTGTDINFTFSGFGITGKVVTAGQSQGPSGVSVQLVSESGDVRETTTSAGGDFHFTPVIPGKYTVKASHPRWKLDPSKAVVHVKEGNTALSAGALAVRGYDVRGSVHSDGHPITGLHVLLYSKEDSPKYRVEGCKTALLQGVPDAPICYSVTDASGEFSFGLVPAGEYRLLALAKTPGQAVVSFNVRPESVKFSVAHDSQFLANAFEVTGFTVTGSAVSGSSGVAGARVAVNGAARAVTDSAGRYTLPGLQPGIYTVTLQHEQCEFDDVKLSISPNGAVTLPEARVARWKVCGVVTPADDRDITITAERSSLVSTVTISRDTEGEWCTFLPPGTYNAKVEVSEKEKSDGLQFYPMSQQFSVSSGPVTDVRFSQLKARLSGVLRCRDKRCHGLTVTLTSAGGATVTTDVKEDGSYSFSDVLPGGATVSVPSDELCWRAAQQQVTVAAAEVLVPPFDHHGYRLRVLSAHNDVEWQCTDGSKGVVAASARVTSLCVPAAARVTLRAVGCSVASPDQITLSTDQAPLPLAEFKAVSHGATVTIHSPQPVEDLMLRVNEKLIGPLAPKAVDGHYQYALTLQIAEGEVALVSAQSASLVFRPAEPQQLVGARACQPRAAVLRAAPARAVAGRTRPPVRDATVTLHHDDGQTESVVTGEDGTYHFGPLDAARLYTVTASKDSWVFSEPDDEGTIAARRLASLSIRVTDDEGRPLQGALVSVTGGSYRRNAATDAAGSLVAGSLAPAKYYVKPHLKEYRFEPPHHLAAAVEGEDTAVDFVGRRVAWSCSGAVTSLGGAGWARAAVLAAPLQPDCAAEGAPTEHDGTFRIRGLVPGCQYRLQLKDGSEPELAGLRLAHRAPVVEVTAKEDITGVRLVATVPQRQTDGAVRLRCGAVEHYRSLRLALSGPAGNTLYSTAFDAAGFDQHVNPGVLVVLPRLPADNGTYVLTLRSSLPRNTYRYTEPEIAFVSDGEYKHFDIDFVAKAAGTEQELRAAPLLGIPVALIALLCWRYRDVLQSLVSAAARAAAAAAARRPRRPAPAPAPLLDRAAIDQIVSSVAAAGKNTKKKAH